MAIEKTIKLNVETGDAKKNTEDLTNVIKEQKAILIELEREYIEASSVLNKTSKSDFQGRKIATKQIEHLRDSIKDQKLSLRELNIEQTSVNKISADSTKAHMNQGRALDLLDQVTGGYLSESIELYEKTTKGVESLGKVTKNWTITQKIVTAGQYLWNLAVSLNPIGLLVAGVVALIGVGVALFQFFSNAEAATKKHTKEIESNEKALKRQSNTLKNKSIESERAANQELAMAKASGMSAKAIRQLELKLIDEKIARERSTKATLLDTYETNKNSLAKLRAAGADEELIKKQAELTAEAGKNILAQNDNIKNALGQKKDIINAHLVEIKTAEVQSDNESKTRASESAKERNEKQKEDEKERLELIAEAKEIELEKQKEFLEQIDELKEKNIQSGLTDTENELRKINAKYKALEDAAIGNAEQLKIIAEAKGNEIAIVNKKIEDKENERLANVKALKDELTLSEDEIAIQKIQDDYAKKIELAQNDADLIVLINADRATKINDIEQKAADKLAAIEKKKKDDKIQGVKDGLSVIGDLAELFAGKSRKQQKKAFDIQKAVNIAGATIDTYKAATGAYASMIASTGPAGPILAPLAAAAAITAGLLNVKKIASQKFDGGGSPSGGGGGGGGGASLPDVQQLAPSFNIVGNSNVNQLSQLQNQPMKAYVVSGDVSSAQSLDRNRIENATL